MTANYKKLLAMTQEHKNEIVLEGFEVVLLLEGVESDEYDYYWRFMENWRRAL
jgi:effector-binding domain-containing protein